MDTSEGLKKAAAERLKKARKAIGLTQKALCARIGMPFSSLRNYESGDQMPGGKALARLMRAGIAPDWLVTGEGEMFCKPAALLGVAISDAIRESGLTVDEVASRSGVDVSVLRAVADGAAMPPDGLLERVSEITGSPLAALVSAREMSDMLAEIHLTNARATASLYAEEPTTEYSIALNAAEDELLDRFRRADEKGKTLLLKISAAVAAPTLKAWFEAGLALSEAATIFEPKR